MKKILIISLSFITSFNYNAEAQNISEENITRTVAILSADSMMGRKVFTPGIDMAASYLASQFEEIGLKPLDGTKDYKQIFDVYKVIPEKSTLIINGAEIDSSSYFFSSNFPEINWTDTSDIEIINIMPEDALFQVFNKAKNLDKDVLLRIPEAMENMFERVRGYLTQSVVKEQASGNNILFLLADDSITSVTAQVANKVQTMPLTNVVGMIPGKKKADEMVVFSAHYDHIGILPTIDGDSIANGADDNASGTAAVVELARHFSNKGKPERTLIFVAFTAEEIGGYGSQYFSEQLDPEKIVAMFNIEMIGKPSKFGANTAFITGFERSDFGKIVQGNLESTAYVFHPDPYPDQNLFYRSDNATLARLGVPAHTISTVPIDTDPYYHTVNDEIETLDLDHLTNTVKAIAKSASGIIQGKKTPDRVDKATVH